MLVQSEHQSSTLKLARVILKCIWEENVQKNNQYVFGKNASNRVRECIVKP